MGEYDEAVVTFDVTQRKHAVAIAEGGRGTRPGWIGKMPHGA
jgi:hypothetical protein